MHYQIFQGVNGQWYWHLRSSGNNKIIAAGGEGYHNEKDCLHAIGLVMDSNRNTPIYKV
jgi:uncharacterized protein YegP (UPF0339 family)